MSFKLLKQVIAFIKKESKCPFCTGGFIDDAIFILGTSANAGPIMCSGLFFVICPKCFAQAFVMVEVTNITGELKKEFIHITTKSAQGISINEVLDMHNFLKSWEGDVKELFKEL